MFTHPDGRTATIVLADDAEMPYDFNEEGGEKFFFFHNRMRDVGTKKDFNADDFSGWDEMEKYLVERFNPAVILPCSMYEHGGVYLYIGSHRICRWDSGRVGFILLTKEDAYNRFYTKRITPKIKQRITDGFHHIIEQVSGYLNGDVYEIRYVEDEDIVYSGYYYGTDGYNRAVDFLLTEGFTKTN